MIACNGVRELQKDGFVQVCQPGGPVLSYSPASGAKLIRSGRNVFRDLDRDGELDIYEDWRRTPEERVADLTGKLSELEMAGLMQCSHMQALPGTNANHYGGKNFRASGAAPSDLTDEQRAFLGEDMVRSVLLAGAESLPVAVKWNNNIQSFVEGLGHGIPVAVVSDPRNGVASDKEYEAGAGGEISMWPGQLGLAATFDPSLVEEFGRVASAEYRAMGISTALSPQADMPGEPRWWRFDGTFGEHPQMTADMVRAYCDGFQTTDGAADGWGAGSVNTMVKHWYGYGAQEGGREGHFAHGEYGVFPSGNLEMFRRPFVEGAFALRRGTGKASAVMTNYSVLWNQDPSGENVGCSYSAFVIDSMLRRQSCYDGLVCTDWDVTYDNVSMVATTGNGRGKPWGVEDLSIAERHFRILEVGVDQFGGNNDSAPVLEAYRMWEEKYGAQAARSRFELSAGRVLLNMFRVGVFENPYVDLAEASAVVGCPEFMEKGYQAQLRSIVMLKNHGGALPVASRARVYLPKRHYPATPGVWGGISEDRWDYALNRELTARCYDVVDSPEDADFAIVAIEEPSLQIGYDLADVAVGGNGYVPVSLQYEDYTAVSAPAVSIAGGNPLEKGTNRSFRGKTVHTRNIDDLLLLRSTRAAMGDKPVILIVHVSKPLVMSEIEPLADAVLLDFGVQDQALLDVVRGAFEPSGLLPMQLPASMQTVETQAEDCTRDMDCHRDSDGNVYDFGFGLGWNGRISDSRTGRYR